MSRRLSKRHQAELDGDIARVLGHRLSVVEPRRRDPEPAPIPLPPSQRVICVLPTLFCLVATVADVFDFRGWLAKDVLAELQRWDDLEDMP